MRKLYYEMFCDEPNRLFSQVANCPKRPDRMGSDWGDWLGTPVMIGEGVLPEDTSTELRFGLARRTLLIGRASLIRISQVALLSREWVMS
jgi:hypothetical protein